MPTLHTWCKVEELEIALCNLLITSIIYHIAHSVENSIDLTETRSGCLYFSPNCSTQMHITSTMQTLPFEGHSVAYQCKGLEKQNFNTNC